MSSGNVSLLVDAAVARGGVAHAGLTKRTGAISLYKDLGDDATTVGPWLVPLMDLEQLGAVALPDRHGVSELHHDVDVHALVAHLGRIRQLSTDDGQTFYLRYADTRALAAVDAVFTPRQRAALMGCVRQWRYVDRYGDTRELAAAAMPGDANDSQGLVLSAKQMDALLDAMLPDQLCASIVELRDERMQPDRRPQQFRHIEAAAQYILARDVNAFPLQRAIARQAILSEGEVLKAAAFAEVVSQCVTSGTHEPIDACWPGDADTGARS